MSFVRITEKFIEDYLNDPNMSVLPNLYQGNNIYHLFKTKSTIALYDDKNNRILPPLELNKPNTVNILSVLNKLGITHTINPPLSDRGGKRRSKFRFRRKRSHKRKKYKRRQHTYRKIKTKV